MADHPRLPYAEQFLGPDTLAEARRIIAGLAGPWAVDETYAPTTGDHCAGCEMLLHCAAGRAHLKAG